MVITKLGGFPNKAGLLSRLNRVSVSDITEKNSTKQAFTSKKERKQTKKRRKEESYDRLGETERRVEA